MTKVQMSMTKKYHNQTLQSHGTLRKRTYHLQSQGSRKTIKEKNNQLFLPQQE